MGGRLERDGDADVGDYLGRHDRTSVFGRDAFYPILLRAAVCDDNFVPDGRAVFYRARVLPLTNIWKNALTCACEL